MLKENYPEGYQSLFTVFNFIYPLSDELKAAIVNNSNVVNFKRKTTLLNAGETSNTIYFIVAGAARVYYLDKDGKQTNTWFLFENELLISVYSFFTAQPSFEYIETLEEKHSNNYGDIVWWDMLFGTYENPKEFKSMCGFDNEKEQRLVDMIKFRDVHKRW
ncbi:cyclic nucleotide-binding domain-containing protein [Pedobacter ghigonis]|uniref:cyclic nucleotide-binding domain-containing protein n=1 Tax=Pedobacter ghigonis TaxID=2730403 RepID=UPI00158B398C|nr:cyclic nucleotide-binding domain-containing protein [Pedobacter ghigonis]